MLNECFSSFQILPVLLFIAATRCKCDSINGYRNTNGASQFGEILKPPPPPPLSPIAPVPFHLGPGRLQRQNADAGYQYQPPPPPPPPLPPSADFKFPAPFYKQYNFNFVPPPQPFSTTPSPSLFNKVSSWLFPSQQTGYDLGSNGAAPVKKDCNPCNLVPWIPVIRYNLGAQKNVLPSSNPTYGPPSPTAYPNIHNALDFKSQPFQNPQHSLPQLSTGVPHAVYGPPALSQVSTLIPSSTYRPPISTYGPPISTYGPPSPTHFVSIPSPNSNSLNSPYISSSTSFSAPSSSYGVPSSTYGAPSASIRHPSSTYSISSSPQGISSTSYSISSSSFATPSPSYGPPSTIFATATPLYEPEILNNQLPPQNDVEVFKHPSEELQLPKVTTPTTFKNSYGEPISNSYIADIPYPVSATAAESMKIKTEVLPNSTNLATPNVSLANPAPFSLNRGRNIHTLQPVALPNLSVSPLPPIFNARPFRPQPNFSSLLVKDINSIQTNSNNVKIEQSVPLGDFTHSIDYPASFVQSPLIEVEAPKVYNQTKAYRNIPNAFIVNRIKDISSQASEDHVSATKDLQDSSFESTGADVGNDLYDSVIPLGFKQTNVPKNHKSQFADLRGVKDEDVDKYRTESNLQTIDSPLLYLKPSAPHKESGNFVLAISTPTNDHDYELYDDIPTTPSPHLSTHSSAWDESGNDYSDGSQPPTAAQESVERPKIVQIIVPYTSGRSPGDWDYTQEIEYQARKIPTNTEKTITSTVTESYYNSPSTTTEESAEAETDSYESERINTAAILNDLYDVKEPPFDIIKLQHTIDDWTEQEYSEHYKSQQKSRGSEKYAKKIPDEYFTSTMPTNYVTATNDYNYIIDDHEVSSSIQHSVTDDKNSTYSRPLKEYNIIDRPKTRHSSSKNDEEREVQKLHIYTAASTFRSTTTTPAPWGKILTSISPLTKEKVYVVTSKPWREARNITNEWYGIEPFESKRTNADNDVTASDNLPFKSPRFSNRPPLGFTSSGENDSVKSDSSYGFSKSWYQSSKHQIMTN